MNCPKCHHEQPDDSKECVRCGIIFEKYEKIQQTIDKVQESIDQNAEPSDEPSNRFAALFFHTEPEVNHLFFAGRVIVFIGILIGGLQFIFSPMESDFFLSRMLHYVNLPFHEAGHIIFRPFGRIITSLGGTLGQLLMPLTCFFVLLIKTRDAFGASVSLWWFGENFFDIAPYINDARSLSLPLLGGNFGHSSPYGFHDWEFILKETHLAHLDHTFAKMSMIIGTLIILFSLLWGGILLFKQYKRLMKLGPDES